MSNKVKDINIKNHTYYFFDGITNIKNFDTNNVKAEENSYKNILSYCLITAMICTRFTTSDVPYFQQSKWIF